MINPVRQLQERTSVSIARYGIDNRPEEALIIREQLSAAVKRSQESSPMGFGCFFIPSCARYEISMRLNVTCLQFPIRPRRSMRPRVLPAF